MKEVTRITSNTKATMIQVTILPYIHPNAYCSGHMASDYMLDMVYHGMSSIPEVRVQQLPSNPFMFNKCNKEEMKKIWGRGFTLYGLLNQPAPEFDIDDSDLIIVALHHTMCNDQEGFYRAVSSVVDRYGKDKVCVIDGGDRPEYSQQTASLCAYFKRELEDGKQNALPIFFGMPEEHFWPTTPDKNELKRIHDFSPMIPANFNWNSPHTNNYHKFDNEDAYYAHYRDSYFGLNCKKGGWQVGRTGEIIGNNCLIYFTDIEAMPKNTWHNFPRELCIAVKRLKGVYPNTITPYYPNKDTYIGDTRQIIPGNGGRIDWDEFEPDKYYSLLNEMKGYYKSNLTTKCLARYILETVI